MKNILLIHGPNLNSLGQRDVKQYGSVTLAELEALVTSEAKKLGYDILCFQSNHEGALIDYIQVKFREAVGIIINPGALTHYGYALHDALADARLPAIEVHLSDINNREEWRKISVIAPVCVAQIIGKKEQGYVEAMRTLNQHLSKK